VIQGALQRFSIKASDLAAVGITNQRETTLVWNRRTGKPYYNAIVWQDTRTDTICNTLALAGGQDRFRPKTGLPLATYFSGPKIQWISRQRRRRTRGGCAVMPFLATSIPG
jgi:glycerol kinase